MCYFITLGVPAGAQARMLAEFGRGFMLVPTENPSIRRELPPTHPAVLLTTGMCSCGLFSGSGMGPSTLRRRAGDRWRGWSAAKARRAAAASARSRTVLPATALGLRPDVAAKLAAVAEAGWPIAVCAHFYSGAVEAEEFAVARGPHLLPMTLRSAPESIAQDTLIWIDPLGGRGRFTSPDR